MMLTGLGITGVIYVLVAIFAVALVPVAELGEGDTPLTKVVSAGLPDFPIDKVMPFIAMFAVANSALINMLMASRLLYGMARQDVLPPALGWVHKGRQTPWVAIIFTTTIAFGLIYFVSTSDSDVVPALGGTTALLLLGVFTIVNIAVLVLRRDPIDREHFVTPTVLPFIGAAVCFYFTLPVTGRDPIQYTIAAWLLGIGVRALGADLAGEPALLRQEDLPARPRGARERGRHPELARGRAGRLAHDELGRQHDRLVRLVVVEQGPQQQVGGGVALAGDVLAHRGQAQHPGEHEVVDADDRQVLGHAQPEPAGALAHPDGHLVGRRDDGGRAVARARAARRCRGRRPRRSSPSRGSRRRRTPGRGRRRPRRKASRRSCGVWMWATFWGTAPM